MMRLTTDAPKTNLESALNLFYAKDGEAWVLRGGSDSANVDVTLFDYIRSAILNTLGPNTPILDLDNEEIGNVLSEGWLFDGNKTVEGIIATLYTAGWVAAELRARLKMYEDRDDELPRYIPYEERRKVYSKALSVWGDRAQMIVAIEELSECQKEICKILRGGENFPHLAEEIADATIMLEQLRLIFNINDQVCECMDAKVRRLQDLRGR
ncbi:MAG: hypothetical protein IKT52_13550 [Oscillospiraceae bacterium]|nr:hypothetical protein [Oscillospiraceae bacterium]